LGRTLGSVSVKNISRNFDCLCKRADVARYAKPLHTLRKSCITDWAKHFPAHVVKQWAGHSDLDTTDRYYLQVSEAEYERAASTRMSQEATQLAENETNPAEQENAENPQPSTSQELPEGMGDEASDQDSRLTQMDVVAEDILPFVARRGLESVTEDDFWCDRAARQIGTLCNAKSKPR